MSLQDLSHNNDLSADVKEDFGKNEHVEEQDRTVVPASFDNAYKSKWEELDRVKTIRLFWKMSLVCFVVAFSAAADGYQVSVERPL